MSSNTTKIQRPFLWGAATSSHQVEGGNVHNDWWAWEEKGNIEGGVRSGAATDHWHRYKEDLKLAESLGLNTYRFSIEWSRVEPRKGRWDQKALDWYVELVAECERRGLLPMATLHHFTSPQWFAEDGGFTNEKSAGRFAVFVEKVLEAIGPRIPLWCTLNEPMVLVVGSYLGKFMPPAEFNPKGASQACRNLLRAHVKAYDLIHAHAKTHERQGPWKDHPVQVGLAHNMIDLMPDRWWHPVERLLQRVFWRFYNQAWLDAVTGRRQRFGVPGLVPKPEPVKKALGRKTADFIGVNYYTKAYLSFRPRDASDQNLQGIPVGVSFARRKEPVTDMDWALHPEGLKRMIRMAASYGLPIYVTENGIADKEDSLRPGYLKSHLGAVAQCLEEGIDVRGYYYWSLLDNFEWIKGFKPRFGLISVNYETFERKLTGSAEWLKKIIHRHQSGAPSTSILRP
ncbi:MAG TPA: glycoside hydrolase family 1 protein [Bdellovibrionota bacterium]|nr:glycoside hydrolase family 1 protein [Bdellovibrionota bacterium]